MLRIYHSLEEAAGSFGPCALTIGNFDGVHAGHRRILRRLVALARERGWKPSALTFDPHPLRVVSPGRAPRLLTTPEQRARLMGEAGIEQVLILPFTRALSLWSPEEFVRMLAGRLGARAVLVGDNFRFGHKHAGDTRLLAELGHKYGYLTEIVLAGPLRGRSASSSEVRRAVQAGEVARAARILERPFALEGDVVPGHGVGSKQTVPTLNLAPRTDLLPATGVYITRARDLDEPERAWPSVTNVGYRPTFGGDSLTVETFLLEPLEGAAPRQIRVEFLRRIREERKFASAAELKTQILRDAGRAQAYFRRLRRFVHPAAGCGVRGPVVR